MHTTWGWTQGLLQYRDFFDNHTPLFHILFSPLVAALGERTNILDFMRFAMVPLWFVCWWCVWKISAALFSRRVGIVGHGAQSACSAWWLLSPRWNTAPTISGRRSGWGPWPRFVCGYMLAPPGLAGGVLLGLCFAVSLKTSLHCAGARAGHRGDSADRRA